MYTYADADTAVSRAVVLGLLKKEEIPKELLAVLEPRMDLFRE